MVRTAVPAERSLKYLKVDWGAGAGRLHVEHALWLHHLSGLYWSLHGAAYKLIGLWSTQPHLPAIWAALSTSLWSHEARG